MNYSQSYIDFIEGNLAPDSELEFAQNLATDEDFRSGFKSFMEITNSIKANATSFAPTQVETNNIYQKLGYILPNGGNSSLIPEQIGKSFFWNNAIRSLLIAIPTAIVTFIITWLLIHNGSHIGNSTPTYTNNTRDIAYNSIVSDNNIDQNKPIETQTIVKYIYVNKYPLPTSQNSDNVETTEQDTQTKEISEVNSDKELRINEINPLAITLDNDAITNKPELGFIDNIPENFENPQFNLLPERKKLGLSFEVRNAATWNLPKETIYPSYVSKLNNMGLTLFYNFNTKFSVGIDLRQETFYLKYHSLDQFNEEYLFEQQPNFFSYGLVSRFSPLKYNSFEPYMQASISRNNFGFILRANTGLLYQLYPNFYLSCNLEYSNLFYNHQNKMYNGKKVGFNYGINYKF